MKMAMRERGETAIEGEVEVGMEREMRCTR
jgi:hypothetical protein